MTKPDDYEERRKKHLLGPRDYKDFKSIPLYEDIAKRDRGNIFRSFCLIDSDCAMVYASLDIISELESEIRHDKKLGFTEIIARRTDAETGETTDDYYVLFNTPSLRIAKRLAEKYNNSTLIYKDDSSCRMISAEPNPSIENVRVYKVCRHGVLDLEVLKQMFVENEEDGLELYYMTQPKPSMFRGSYGPQRIM